MEMKIGLCYDLKDTYDINSNAIYNDFSFLSEVEYVEMTLTKLGHKVILINGIKKFIDNIPIYKKECDIIFNMIEGYKSRNREGIIPALCEAYEIAYTGTDSFGLSLSLNKYHMSQVVKSLGINTPHAYLIDYPITNNTIVMSNVTHYPCIIKPNHEGSSMGVVLVNSYDDFLKNAHNLSKLYSQQLVVEEYIPGIELSIGILGTGQQAYVYSCLEFINEDGSNIEIFDYKCKYKTKFQSIFPRLERNILKDICQKSLAIHRSMHFRDVSRIDWRVNMDIAYFIEATPLPAFDKDSDFDITSKIKGESFEKVLSEILFSALSRRRNEFGTMD